MHLPNHETLSLLNYRMAAVAIGHLALEHTLAWDEIPSIEIFFDGKQVIEGNATTFTNGAIESAILHCRALLEFLGLGEKNQTTLAERKDRRRGDDVGVEHFGNLSRVSIATAVQAYPGPRIDAESSLAYVMYLANKGLAHTTTTFNQHDEGAKLLEIAFRGVPVLLINNFYIPLGLELPAYELQSRTRVV